MIKEFGINNKIKTLDKYQIVLLYGENEGLKDLKNKIKNNYDKRNIKLFSRRAYF